jgi:predicted transporter
MELKSLWLGLVVALGAFAVKTGLGWAYLWAERPPGRKVRASAAVFIAYALLFAGVYRLVTAVNLLAHYEWLLPLWRGGSLLHWLTALMLLLWGLILLKSEAQDCGDCRPRRSRGWLALVVPCPVCLSVVLMSAAGLALYFPAQAGLALAGLFAAFIAIAALSGLVMIKGRGAAGRPPESALGLAMILMASYFIVLSLVMPQFSEISQVYRLAAYAGEGRAVEPLHAVLTFGALLALMAFGYFMTTRAFRARRVQ